MRLIPVLLLTVALATASGCFGKDDGDGETPTPTTPTGATPTGATPTGATPTPTNATPTTPTTPAKPPAKELCPVTKDFQSQQPDPATQTAITTGDCGTVTAGYTKLTLTGNFTSGEPVMLAQGINVKVLDSTGAAVITCPGPGPGAQAVTACSGESAAAAGAYTLQFEGVGNIDFAGSVTVS